MRIFPKLSFLILVLLLTEESLALENKVKARLNLLKQDDTNKPLQEEKKESVQKVKLAEALFNNQRDNDKHQMNIEKPHFDN